MDNQRKSERFSCLVPVDGQRESIYSHLQTVDFSSSGLGFLSKKEIPLNQEVAIELDLQADDDPAFVVGIVKWVQKTDDGSYRVGLQFKDQIDDSQTRIDQYFSK